MKRPLLILVILYPLVFYQSSQLFAIDRPVRTVLIDPGHGGKDPGAVGRRNMEKDIVLSVSLKLGELINQYMPEVNVVFTRKTDVFIGLNERANIANRNNADLFISIHCNGAGNRSAIGSETFVMGNDKSESNLAVAMKENASIYFEQDYQDIYDGFDPSKPETHIIFSLFQHQYLNQSLKFASLVQDQFRDRIRRVDRGVKQGPFWVLHRTAMPAVLVELGFITNEDEEQFMASNEGQNLLASAIFRAFRDYKNSQDQLALGTNASKPLSAEHAPANPRSPNQSQPQTDPRQEPRIQAQPRHQNQPENNPATQVQPQPQAKAQFESPAEPKVETTPAVAQTSKPATTRPDVVFKVQFLSSEKSLPPNSPQFKGLENVENYLHLGLFRYTVGNEPTLEAASQLQSRVRKQGFRDAFIVAFVNGKRSTIQEAQKLVGL